MHSEYCSDGGSVEIVYPYTLRIVRGGTRKRVDVRTTYSYSKMPERIRRAFTIPTTMFVVYNRNRRVGDVDNVGIAHTLRVRCAVERRIEGLEHMHILSTRVYPRILPEIQPILLSIVYVSVTHNDNRQSE